MEYISEDDVLVMGISLFKIMGEFTPYKWQTPIKIYRSFNCFVCVLNIILLMANLARAEGYMYIRIFESICTIAHPLLKYVCLFYYTPEILDLIRKTQQFYDVRDFKDTFLFAKTLLSACKIVQKLLLILGAVSLQLYFLKPITTGLGFIFPSRIIADSLIFDTVILSTQYYYLLMVGVIIPGYDSLYIGYAIHLIIQLRILKYKFEHTTQNVKTSEIREYIRYHQLLLSIFAKMRGIYLWMFLFFYILTLISACVQLYMLLLGGDKISDSIMAVIYIVVLLMQLSFYTIPVEEIVRQFSEISGAIYKSLWYERSLQDRKLLLIVMMKAQRQNYLSAGGIIDMNADTFMSVIRKVFSFYAILKNVLNK